MVSAAWDVTNRPQLSRGALDWCATPKPLRSRWVMARKRVDNSEFSIRAKLRGL